MWYSSVAVMFKGFLGVRVSHSRMSCVVQIVKPLEANLWFLILRYKNKIKLDVPKQRAVTVDEVVSMCVLDSGEVSSEHGSQQGVWVALQRGQRRAVHIAAHIQSHRLSHLDRRHGQRLEATLLFVMGTTAHSLTTVLCNASWSDVTCHVD